MPHGAELAPEWRSARVELRAIRNTDLDFLYHAVTSIDTAYRWRFRGAIPDSTEFATALKNGVLVQFVVEKRATREPVGIVMAYNASQRDGYVYAAALSAPQFQDTGLVVDGLALFLDYLFRVWPFRKVYFESIEYNSASFASAYGHILNEEARLRSHTFYADHWWDVITSAIYRQQWTTYRSCSPPPFPSSVLIDQEPGYLLMEETEILTLEGFCEMLGESVPGPRGPYLAEPDQKLKADIGYDSLNFFEIAVLIDELAGRVLLDWPEQLETVRDLYIWYATACSLPKDRDRPMSQQSMNRSVDGEAQSPLQGEAAGGRLSISETHVVKDGLSAVNSIDEAVTPSK